MKRTLLTVVVAMVAGYIVGVESGRLCIWNPTECPTPYIIADGLGGGSQWDTKDARRLLDRGRKGFEYLLRRLDREYDNERILSADLQLLGRFANFYSGDLSDKENSDIEHVLLRGLHSKQSKIVATTAMAVLYYIRSPGHKVIDAVCRLDSTNDPLLNEIVVRIKGDHGLGPKSDGGSAWKYEARQQQNEQE